MPELDILHGFEYVVTRAQEQHLKEFGVPLHGHLEIWPRTFATSTDAKPWWTSCVVHDLGMAGADAVIGIDDPAHVPHPHDLRRCKGEKGAMWKPYTERRLESGDICKFTRGKEFCIGVGKKKPQMIAIMAAIVCDHTVFLFVDFSRMIRLDIVRLDRDWVQGDLVPQSPLWDQLWDSEHGPDWIVENDAAEARLDEWRATVLANTDVTLEEGLVEVICSKQKFFNGYGRHTAHDLLHHFHVWPGTPPSVVCGDDYLYDRFKILLGTYARQFVGATYRERCLGMVNMDTPFAFNYKSDDNYLSQYVKVYRKWSINIPAAEYNDMYMDGLLDPQHTIGLPYRYDEAQLLGPERQFCTVVVDSYPIKDETWYTIIKAQRPETWKYGLTARTADVPVDVRHAGMSTTLGPASFHPFKQNQFDPKVYTKRGRPKKHKTGNRGRPRIEPTAQKIKARVKRGVAAREKAVLASKASNAPASHVDVSMSDEDPGSGGHENHAEHHAGMMQIQLEAKFPGRRITRGMTRRAE
ncbi:hypothetical protein LXA43DRAFT_1103394 [Ganoderma leucocontextum]|nr:hypothetical protein LXA43DRAFT_1103394 [Ganoderma leucocontextum]